MCVWVRSQVPRICQNRVLLLTIGRLTPSSIVLLSSVPAFCHWVEKPSDAAVETGRIWSRVTACAYVTSKPTRPNSVKSVPTSSSVVVSGLISRLPAWPRVTEVPLTE